MSFGGGLQTTANVNIKVGVQRQSSFTKFEQQLAAMKASLNEVSSGTAAKGSGAPAPGSTRDPMIQRTAALERARQNLLRSQRQSRANTLQQTSADLRVQSSRQRTAAQQFRTMWDRAYAAVSSSANKVAQRTAQIAKNGYRGTGDQMVAMYKANQKAMEAAAKTSYKGTGDQMVKQFKKDMADRLRQAKKDVSDRLKLNKAAAVQATKDAKEAARQSDLTLSRNQSALGKMLVLNYPVPKGVDRNRFRAAAKEVQDYARTMDPARTKVSLFTAQLRKLDQIAAEQQAHMKSMKTSIGYRLDQTEKQLDAIFRASFRLQMIGSNISQFGQRIKQFLTGIMDTFGEFQYNMNRAAGALSIWDQVSTKTQVGIDALQESILGLSRESRLFEAKDVAEALYFWASATGEVVKTNEDLMKNMGALESIMKASALTNTSYEATIKGVYSIIQQYYSGNIQVATHVTEALFHATQATALEFTDLINSFKMVGPVAKANNVSFEDMVALLGRLGDLGIRGTMAGRAFRQMFIQLVRPSAPAKKAIDELFNSLVSTQDEIQKLVLGGKSYEELVFPKGVFVGTEKYLNILAAATLRLKSSARNAFLSRITTANELPVMLALVGQAQKELSGFGKVSEKYATQSQRDAETMAKSWDLLAKSWKGVSGSLSRAWEHLQIQIGSILADVLGPLLERVTEVVEQIRLWAKANPELIKTLGRMAGLASGAAIVAGAVFTIVGSIMALMTGITLVLRTISPWLFKFVAGFGAVGAVIIGLVRNFDYFQASVQYAFDTVAKALSDNSDVLKTFGDLFESTMNTVIDISDTVVRSASDAIRILADLFAAFMKLDAAADIIKAVGLALTAMIAGNIILGMASLTRNIISLTFAIFTLGKSKTFMNEFNAVKMGAAASSMGVIRKQVVGLRGAISMLGGTIGPGGIVALLIGAGFVAYETNFMNLKDKLNDILLVFRDMRKEVDDLADSFTGFAGGAKNLAEKIFPSLSDSAADAIVKMSGLQGIVAAAQDPFQVAFNPVDVITSGYRLFTDAGRGEEQAKRLEEQKLLLERIVQGVNGINTTRQDLGLSAIGLGKSTLQLDKLYNAVGNFDDAFKIFSEITSKPAMNRQEITKLFNSWKLLGYNLGNLNPTSLFDILGDNVGYNLDKVAIRQKMWTKVYAPILQAIQDAEDAGNDDLAAGLMTSPVLLPDVIKKSIRAYGFFGGLPNAVKYLLPSPSEVMDSEGMKGWSQDAKEWYMSLLGRLGDGLAGFLDENAAEETTLSEIITGSLKRALDSQISYVADNFIATYQDFFTKLTTLVQNADFSSGAKGKNVGEIVNMLFVEKAFDGKTLAESIKDNEYLDKASLDVVKVLVETLVDDGIISPDKLKYFDTAGADAGEAVADNFLSGLVSSLKNHFSSSDLKAAMALGSDTTQAGKWIADFMDKTVAKALRKGHKNSATILALQERDESFVTFLENWQGEHPSKKSGKALIRMINEEYKLDTVGLTPHQKQVYIRDRNKRIRQVYAIYGITPPKPPKGGGKGWDKGKDFMGILDSKVLFGGTKSPATVAGNTAANDLVSGFEEGSPGIKIVDSLKGGFAEATPSLMDTVFSLVGDINKGVGQTVPAARNTAVAAMNMYGAHVKMYTAKAYNWGHSLGWSWATGASDGASDRIGQKGWFQHVIDILKPAGSPPKSGPLHHLDKWGETVGASWGEGMAEGIRTDGLRAISSAQRDIKLRSLAPDAQVSYHSEHERRLRIEVDIKSSDGTANRKTQSEIRDASIKALSIDAVSHLSQVG